MQLITMSSSPDYSSPLAECSLQKYVRLADTDSEWLRMFQKSHKCSDGFIMSQKWFIMPQNASEFFSVVQIGSKYFRMALNAPGQLRIAQNRSLYFRIYNSVLFRMLQNVQELMFGIIQNNSVLF